MFWFFGALGVLGARVFLAGTNSKNYFYKEVRHYRNNEVSSELDGDLVLLYCGFTAFLALLWPIALPSYGLYLLGKKYAK